MPLGNNTGNASSSHCLSSINETGCLFPPVLFYRLYFLLNIITINILCITRSELLYFYWHCNIIMFMDIGDIENFF